MSDGMKNLSPFHIPEKHGRVGPRLNSRLVFFLKRVRPFNTPGLTIIELMIVIAMVGTLAAIATTSYISYLKKADIAGVIYTISNISTDIKIYQADHFGNLPETLDDLDKSVPLDPWGNPYQYQDVNNIPKGKRRKDKFLVPLNSDYDLWSMGPDGKSRPPLTAKASRDDIIRAGDGRYIGVATGY